MKQHNQTAQPDNGWAAWSLIGISMAALLVIGGTTLTEHGLIGQPTASQTTPVAEGAIVIEMRGMRFVPNVVEVKPGEDIVLQLINRDDMAHDLKVNSVSSGRILPGESSVLEIGALEQDAEGWCTIAGHRSQGMVINFKVTDSHASYH